MHDVIHVGLVATQVQVTVHGERSYRLATETKVSSAELTMSPNPNHGSTQPMDNCAPPTRSAVIEIL